MIFINPDRTNLPPLPNSQICPGLEALTGADIVVSTLPIPPTLALDLHIKEWSLFVQIKIGYDVLSFDALHNFCARAQKSKIPKTQAILLRVGEYWEDENHLLRLKSYKPFGTTTWNDYQRLLMACDVRGINVVPEIRNIDELPQWIENRLAIAEKVLEEGLREVYPPRVSPTFTSDDIWQEVKEVSDDTWEYLLCAGLKGFGQGTVENVREYINKELPHILPGDGIDVLRILTELDDKGKLIHNVKGWGEGKAGKLRSILGLTKGRNISLCFEDTETPYKDGWYQALSIFKQLIDDGHSVKNAFNAVMKLNKEVIEF